jgi:lipopolysaccharide export system protein LptA
MKRRVILLVGSFAVLFVAFMGYWLATRYTGSAENPVYPRDMVGQDEVPATQSAAGNAPGQPTAGWQLFIAPRDNQGRLEGEYKARKWEKIEDYTYRLTEPDVRLYLKDGQTVNIRSETGKIITDRSGRNRPRRLSLSGNVQIDVDRGTEPGLPPLSERPRDHVRILMEHVDFDNEMLSIQTSGPVEVYSSEADLFGNGLLVTWKEAPRELEQLLIEQGRRIVVKEIPEQVAAITPLGAGKKGSPGVEPAPQTQPAPAKAPITQVEQGAKPTTLPAQGGVKDVKEPTKNVFLAQLLKNVRVTSGERNIRGADRLDLTFEWHRSFQRRKQPAAPASEAAASAPQAAARPAVAATKPATEPPLTTMTIEWDGPLVLRPVGYAESPSRRRYTINASGRNVVLAESEATATCKSALFKSDEKPANAGVTQESWLIGTKDEPATLTMADGAKAVCEKMRFDQQAGKAYLEGPGHMIGASGRPGVARTRRAATTAPAATQPADKPDNITWQGGVVATFAEEAVRLEDGRTKTRRRIDEAIFREKVELTQGRTDDFVRCDRLGVKMSRGVKGGTYPGMAVASGNVRARQEGSEIQADTVTVGFREVLALEAADGRTRPTWLEAKGNVKVTDKRNDQVLIAEADRVRSDLVNRSAIMYGWPGQGGQQPRHASISQGSNTLLADQIRVNEVLDPVGRKDYEVHVNSRGTLNFLTDKDLDSQKLKDPRKISITWSESMNYQGHRNVAEFLGNVKLDSGSDHMACQVMRVWFEEKLPQTRPAVKTAAKGTARGGAADSGLALGLEQYSRRTIRMILADGDVALLRRLEDENNLLLRRQQLKSEHLIYDVQYRRVNVNGPGSMVAEDYARPRDKTKEAQAGQAAEITTKVDTPSQTVLKWEEGMDYVQDERQVVMNGDVTMVHRSGDKVVLTQNLRVPDWGKVAAGRATDLRCEKLMVEFLEPAKTKATTATSGPAETATTKQATDSKDILGPRLGSPKKFSASRSVNIKDGPRQVLAQRLIYDYPTDTVVIWGFLSGQPVDNAHLIEEDLATGRSQTWSSPKIIWFRQNDRIITENVSAGGGR